MKTPFALISIIAVTLSSGALLADIPPVKVTSVVINDGAAQRSRVTSVAISFDQHVTFIGSAAEAFEIKRQGSTNGVGLAVVVDNSGTGTVATLSFNGAGTEFGSLADGRYTLTVFAAKVVALDGDGNGTPGDDYVLASNPSPGPPTNIFRLFGDSDGDGDLDALDFLGFRSVFGVALPNSPFDFDGDGVVAAADFLQFRARPIFGPLD